MNKWQALEVEWYRSNGKHPERVVVDGESEPYVIGDEHWNRLNPDKAEVVDTEMRRYVYERMGASNGNR